MSLQYMTAFHYHTEAYRGHFLNQNRYERLIYDAWLFASNILGSIPKEYIEKNNIKDTVFGISEVLLTSQSVEQ